MTRINEYLIVDEFKDIPLSDFDILTDYSICDDASHVSITVKVGELLDILLRGED